MTISPEIKIEIPPTQVEEVIEQFPETPVEAAEKIQATQITPTQPPQIPTDSGQQITPVPAPASPTGPSITIPSDPAALTQQSKGPVTNTATWNAWFWLRMVKKALSKQITVLVKGGAK